MNKKTFENTIAKIEESGYSIEEMVKNSHCCGKIHMGPNTMTDLVDFKGIKLTREEACMAISLFTDRYNKGTNLEKKLALVHAFKEAGKLYYRKRIPVKTKEKKILAAVNASMETLGYTISKNMVRYYGQRWGFIQFNNDAANALKTGSRKTIKQISEEYGISESKLRAAKSKTGYKTKLAYKPYTIEERRTIKLLFELGVSTKSMALLVNREPASVRAYFMRNVGFKGYTGTDFTYEQMITALSKMFSKKLS